MWCSLIPVFHAKGHWKLPDRQMKARMCQHCSLYADLTCTSNLNPSEHYKGRVERTTHASNASPQTDAGVTPEVH
jgi:hypothetical protein